MRSVRKYNQSKNVRWQGKILTEEGLCYSLAARSISAKMKGEDLFMDYFYQDDFDEKILNDMTSQLVAINDVQNVTSAGQNELSPRNLSDVYKADDTTDIIMKDSGFECSVLKSAPMTNPSLHHFVTHVIRLPTRDPGKIFYNLVSFAWQDPINPRMR